MLVPKGSRAACFEAPKDPLIHEHAKSEVALTHWFGMVVYEKTRMLDPTCGSGSAVRAATALGAEYSLGVERDPGMVRLALNALREAEHNAPYVLAANKALGFAAQ